MRSALADRTNSTGRSTRRRGTSLSHSVSPVPPKKSRPRRSCYQGNLKESNTDSNPISLRTRRSLQIELPVNASSKGETEKTRSRCQKNLKKSITDSSPISLRTRRSLQIELRVNKISKGATETTRNDVSQDSKAMTGRKTRGRSLMNFRRALNAERGRSEPASALERKTTRSESLNTAVVENENNNNKENSNGTSEDATINEKRKRRCLSTIAEVISTDENDMIDLFAGSLSPNESVITPDKLIAKKPEIVMLENYKFRFSSLRCSEANRAHRLGSFRIKKAAPGFPLRKFSKKDLKYHGGGDNWVVQAIYPCPNREMRYVIYEGWTSDTGEDRELKELQTTAPEMLEECDLKESIMLAMKKYKDSQLHFPNVSEIKPKRDSTFWCYEEWTYFVNKLHNEYGLGKVFFLVTVPEGRRVLTDTFPKIIYTVTNLLTDGALETIKSNPYGRHIEELIEDLVIEDVKSGEECILVSEKHRDNYCTSENCKCDIRHRCFGITEVQRLKYNENGCLNLENYKLGEPKFLIECSDACGCDLTCPNRQCQNGQQTPTVVCHEGRKGFGVRAGKRIEKGQFIVEYIGVLMKPEEIKNKQTYLMDHQAFSNLVVDATDYSNIGRYINHSCEPNAMFTEVHTRRFEKDLLVPRVGIYALKIIEKGEEICVSYWNEEERNSAGMRRTRCFCGTASCSGYIPVEMSSPSSR